MSFRDQSCVFINVVLLFVIAGMNLIKNTHCKERKLVGESGGGEIISFIVLPPLRHTRWTGRPSRIEINQFFWKLFPVDFGFLKFLGNCDVFLRIRLQSEDTSRTCIWTSGRISQIPRIGRFRGQMQLVCILFETMSMFSLSGYAKGAAGWKGKPGLFYHLGLTEKIQGNWKSAWFLVFHLHPAVDQFTCLNIFHPCFGSELFRFTRLTSISSSTFSSNFLRYLCTWRKWK